MLRLEIRAILCKNFYRGFSLTDSSSESDNGLSITDSFCEVANEVTKGTGLRAGEGNVTVIT